MAGEIERLIGLLDDDATDVAEDAKAALMAIGVQAVRPLMSALPLLQPYGQLSAIEFFEQHWDYDAHHFAGFDYDVGALLVKAVIVIGEAQLTAALETWDLRPERLPLSP